MTSRAREVKEELAVLREQRENLEKTLKSAPVSETRDLRIQLAELSEKMVDLARELRRLMPEHRISRRGGKWDYVNGLKWEALEDKTWSEIEHMESNDTPPTELEMMHAALSVARKSSMTPIQTKYMNELLDQGKRRIEIARDNGKDKSTISRTIKRGNNRLERSTKAAYAILRDQAKWNGEDITIIDLSVPEVMESVLNVLTKRQRLYLYLYYGEWMSLREIQSLCGLESHTCILRSIRSAIGRIEDIALGGQVEISGWDTLEKRLMEHFNSLDLQVLEECSRPQQKRKQKEIRLPIVQKTKSNLWTLFFELPGNLIHQALPEMEIPKPLWISNANERRRGELDDDFHSSEDEHWGSGRLINALKACAKRLERERMDVGSNSIVQIKRTVRNLLYKLMDLVRGGYKNADNH